MGSQSKAFKFGAAFTALGMVLSSTAHAAPTSYSPVDPLVALSVFGTSSSRAAVCAAGTAAASAAATAAATAAQPGPGPGCVLPVLDVAPPPPVVGAPVPVGPVVAEGFNFGGLLPLLGTAALALLAYYLLDDDNDTDDEPDIPEPPEEPESPA